MEASILEDPFAGSCIIPRGKVGTRLFATGGPTTGHRTRLVLGLLAYTKFQVPELGFPVCLILPLWPQTILILASHAWLGQLVASDTRANWSVSIRIFAKAGFLSIYLSARRHSTSCDGVRKGEPAARVRVHSGGRLRGSLRKADYSTDDDVERGPMSKLRGRAKEAKEDVVQT